ncbi:cupredoxin domain-containing protein [Marinobacter sp.]|uniref:cupredoxin domain-containing protein n=1 Tax=Marinobacter sp. TaxID=50741 RepID=UPI00356497C8
MNPIPLMAAATAISISITAFASGTHSHQQGAATGEPGRAADADRTVTIEMYDNYYEPESIDVKAGETVRFIVKNKGDLVHEFRIATADMHDAHQEEMEMMVEHGVIKGDHIDHEMMKMDMGNGQTMEHSDPNSVLMEPGETRELVWAFTEAADLEYACNVPGHYQAGMYGDIEFE